THARAGDADDRVGVFLQRRVRAFFHPDVSGSVQHYASHAHSSSRWFHFYGPASMGPLISQNITPAASSAGRVVVRAKGPGAGDALAARFAVRARGRHAARCGHGALGFAARFAVRCGTCMVAERSQHVSRCDAGPAWSPNVHSTFRGATRDLHGRRTFTARFAVWVRPGRFGAWTHRGTCVM